MTSPEHDHPRRRRRTDRLVILCAVTSLCCLIAVIFFGFTTLDTNSGLDQQKAGRATALSVSCGTNKAIIESGRTAILSGTAAPPPARQEAALRRLGFPPYKVRVRLAQAAARVYARKIAETVQAAVAQNLDTGQAAGLVNRDGTLNCDRYKSLAGAG